MLNPEQTIAQWVGVIIIFLFVEVYENSVKWFVTPVHSSCYVTVDHCTSVPSTNSVYVTKQ